MDIDYYHKDNIENKNVITLYPRDTSNHKRIKPVKISMDYIKNELTDDNTIFLKANKRIFCWPKDYFIRYYLLIDKVTYDIIRYDRFYFGNGFPIKIGQKGVLTSLLMAWAGAVEMVDKFNFLYPNINLGKHGTGTSLLALSYKALPENIDKTKIKLRRNINDL